MVNDMTAWLPVILSGLGIVGTLAGALGGQWLSHRFALKREEKQASEKQGRERYFLACELIFLLERFAEASVQPAHDEGEYEGGEFKYVCSDRPVLDYVGITGDWRYLPPVLVYRLRELRALIEHSERIVSETFNNDFPLDPTEGLFARQYQSARLGLKALFLALRLRQLCGMPPSRMITGRFSAGASLWRVWRSHRHTLWLETLAHRRHPVPGLPTDRNSADPHTLPKGFEI